MAIRLSKPHKLPQGSAHRALGRCLRAVPVLALALALTPTGSSTANTSHAGWPQITGMLLMNKHDQSRPLDARPGHDPFDGTDPSYSCNGEQQSTSCFPRSWWHCQSDFRAHMSRPRLIPTGADTASIRLRACGKDARLVVVVGSNTGHNELLGGHGNNTIHAGPNGDVIWGDFKPSGDPTTQVDYLYGGPGNDIIYAAHGMNYIYSGGGTDIIHAHFGSGAIHCESHSVHLYISHISRPRYKLFGCNTITYD